MSKELPAQPGGKKDAGRAVEVPAQVTARGGGAVAAGRGASYNATAKGATVNDNRVYVTVTPPGTTDTAESSAAEEETDLRAYSVQLRALYGRLDLEVLIPTTEGEHPRMELREVFVPPMLRADPPRMELPVELYRRLVESGELDAAEGDPSCPPGMDRRQWEQARQAYRERPVVALLETVAAADATRVVLLGDPGAGKSTVARYGPRRRRIPLRRLRVPTPASRWRRTAPGPRPHYDGALPRRTPCSATLHSHSHSHSHESRRP